MTTYCDMRDCIYNDHTKCTSKEINLEVHNIDLTRFDSKDYLTCKEYKSKRGYNERGKFI